MRLPFILRWRGMLVHCMVLCSFSLLKGQVVADFSASSTSGCSPLVVTFTNLSTGGPFSSYFWDFGNGNTSILQHPGTIYLNPGTYTVSLTVSGPGGMDSETKVGYITVFQDPNVAIGALPAMGCQPLSVQFTDNSTAFPGPIVNRLWDFGDGNTSTQANPSHVYGSSGTYNALLTVTDANGCSATVNAPAIVNVQPPVQANFSYSPAGGCTAPLTVNFTDLSTGPGPFTYSWDFGDGSPIDNAQHPSHTYTSNNTFSVTLAIENSIGCRDTLVMPNAISLVALNAGFNAAPTTVCVGSPVVFTQTATGFPPTFAWDFGDGGTSNVANPSHAYAAPGTYSVQQIVTRGVGCSDTLIRPNLITVLPNPVAAFSANNNTGCSAPLTVSFVDNSTNAVAWQWNFGDGGTSTLQNPSHTYTAPGSYNVTLTVTGANGCTHTLTQNGIVQIVPPVANFTYTGIQTGCMPRTIIFNDASTSVFDPITIWNWSFGDGATSNVQNPPHTYTTAGVWTVTLIVFTQGGCSDTIVMPNLISTGPVPVANFNANPTTVCYGDPVTFNNMSINANGYFWNFGDGGTSTAQNPTYVYSNLGCYNVTLTANNNGCTDTRTRNNYICIQGTRAGFTVNQLTACDTPATFVFTNTSTSSSILGDLSYVWDFGNGNTSTVTHPSHTFNAFGTFRVTLITTHGPTGCQDTVMQMITISKPNAFFVQNTNGGCANLNASFTNLSTGATSYQWNFGDGSPISTATNPSHLYVFNGSFTVRLIAIDGNGCRDTFTSPVPIVVNDVVPNFTAAPMPSCPGTPITFTDASTSNAAIISWSWNFGDGNTSNVQHPVHSYAAPGTYSISLVATDANGCMDVRQRFNYVVITQPTPNFSLSSTNLCPGENLTLTSTSIGAAPLTYSWNFGDGSPSGAGANTTHSYTANGNYPIQLLVTDANGCQDSVTQQMTIETPVAGFTVDDSISDCPPLVCNFMNTSTGNISSIAWDFGDGSPVVINNPSPSHVYNTPGSFTVTLVVQTATGCSDTLVFPGRVVVNAPSATFSFDPSTTCPGQPVTFVMSAAGSYLPAWDFGDGQLQIGGDTVTHAYSGAGTFTPVLVVQDTTTGCINGTPTQGPITVLPAPVADFGYSDTLLCVADSVFFLESTTYGGGPAGWNWSFGDGGIDSVANPVHFYAVPGTYTVSLQVTDTLGCSDADTVVAAVRLFDYQAGFSVSANAVCPGTVVTFTDASQSDTTILSWTWDFGDLTGGSGPVVSHVYPDTGWYDVRLVIVTVMGCVDTLMVPNAVHVGVPTGSFAVNNDSSCVLNPFQFTFTGGPGVVPTWYFGNGDSIVGGNNVSFGYPAAGTYSVTVVMTDSLGCRDTLVAPAGQVVLPGPVAAFAVDTLVHCEPDSVRLWDLSVYSSNPVSILWDFGDGSGGAGAGVTHYFANPGSYDVLLTVVDQFGCTDAVLVPQAVTIHEQVADFGVDVTTGCLPLTVTFFDSSYCDVPIIQWAWNFGDGSIGSGVPASHVYSDTGSFDVTLAILSSVGCSDTLVIPALIQIEPMEPPVLWAVTVEGDNQATAVFHEDRQQRFGSYELWRETGPGVYVPAATGTVQSDSLVSDFNSGSLFAPACYRTQIVDTCSDSTNILLTTEHCTVDLMVIPGMDQNTLVWTPYVGWPAVTRYDVFVVTDYDTNAVAYLGSVAGNVISFVDSSMDCGEWRAYRVRAIGMATQERSWSDSSAARPLHQVPAFQSSMVTATVLNNQDVTVEWLPATFVGASGYHLYRSTDGVNWGQIATLAQGTIQYVDQSATVGAQSYWYRVAALDSCGYETQVSDVARSILLSLDGSNGVADLSWNAYSNWAGGVSQYVLEGRSSNGGAWMALATLPSSTLTSIDNQGLPNEPGVCYRVRAYEAGGNQATSQSNEVCMSLDVWVPNTLTPNGDGFNEVLIVRALAGYPGTGIAIYNRWGNLVYENEDYQNDWAGTNGKTGEILPDGTYFWVLHVSDGRNLKGYVTILR